MNEIGIIVKNTATVLGLSNPVKISEIVQNQKGEGYLGQIFFASITEPNQHMTHLVIKATFKQDNIRKSIPIDFAFHNEISFYTITWPELIRFQRQHHMEPLQLIPRCVFHSSEPKKEFLVLENLTLHYGFKSIPKSAIFTEGQLKLALETYGYFHGVSMAYKDQHPQKFHDNMVQLYKGAYDQLVTQTNFPDTTASLVKSIAKDFFSTNESILEKLDKYINPQHCHKIIQDIISSRSEYTALLQSDCWTNNILFRTDNNKLEIRLIDWQLVRFASPILDLVILVYTGGDKQLFSKLFQYLDIYYESFSNTVRKLGSSPDKVFPKSAVREHWRQYGKFGLIIATTIVKVKLLSSIDTPDLTDGIMDPDNKLFHNAPFDKGIYRTRLVDIIEHLYELDAL